MKAAASWLGNNWHIETTSITDKVTRILDVDLTEITNKGIEEIESKEVINSNASHGTTFVIESLWPERAIKRDNLKNLKKSIASIYRYFIRRKEIQISIEDEILSFEDYEVLEAPSYKDPDGPDIEWKCPVNTDDRRGHSISGFIALLKDTADEKRGVVIMRNHRVVMGFDPQDRTIGKDFIGQIGSNKYRRVFGELEITGFTVAFGKNQVNDPELLEALCKMAAGKLLIQGVNLLTQCDKYRKKTRVTFPKAAPLETPKPDSNPGIVPAAATPDPTPQEQNNAVEKPALQIHLENGNAHIIAQGKFKFDRDDYRILIEPGDDCDELFWNDLSQRDAKVLICKVNRSHPFFTLYGELNRQLLAMISALSIAKFITGQGKAMEMMNEFNRIINTQEALEQND